MISRAQVDEQLCRQRKKPPIDVTSIMEDLKSMLKVERGRFLRNDLEELFERQGLPITAQDTDTLLKDICENGIVKMNSKSYISALIRFFFADFVDRLTEPNRNVTKARKALTSDK